MLFNFLFLVSPTLIDIMHPWLNPDKQILESVLYDVTSESSQYIYYEVLQNIMVSKQTSSYRKLTQYQAIRKIVQEYLDIKELNLL